jgi:hypothetical protein
LLSVSSVRHALIGWSASQLCPCVLWFRVRFFLFQRTQNVLGYAQRAGLIEQHVHMRCCSALTRRRPSPRRIRDCGCANGSPHPRLRVFFVIQVFGAAVVFAFFAVAAAVAASLSASFCASRQLRLAVSAFFFSFNMISRINSSPFFKGIELVNNCRCMVRVEFMHLFFGAAIVTIDI